MSSLLNKGPAVSTAAGDMVARADSAGSEGGERNWERGEAVGLGHDGARGKSCNWASSSLGVCAELERLCRGGVVVDAGLSIRER